MTYIATTFAALTGPIDAEAYIAVLLQRQAAFNAEHGDRRRYPPLLEWFIQPGDEKWVVLPTAEPGSTRPRTPRVYRSAAAIRSDLAQVEARMKAIAGRGDTGDRAAANLSPHSRNKAASRVGRRRFEQMDRDLQRYRTLAARRDVLVGQLARAVARESRSQDS